MKILLLTFIFSYISHAQVATNSQKVTNSPLPISADIINEAATMRNEQGKIVGASTTTNLDLIYATDALSYIGILTTDYTINKNAENTGSLSYFGLGLAKDIENLSLRLDIMLPAYEQLKNEEKWQTVLTIESETLLSSTVNLTQLFLGNHIDALGTQNQQNFEYEVFANKRIFNSSDIGIGLLNGANYAQKTSFNSNLGLRAGSNFFNEKLEMELVYSIPLLQSYDQRTFVDKPLKNSEIALNFSLSLL